MPQWIDVGGVPVYIDEYGNPTDPPDETVQLPGLAGFANKAVAPFAQPGSGPAPYTPPENWAEPAPAAPTPAAPAASPPAQSVTEGGGSSGKVSVGSEKMSDEQLAKNRGGYREVFKGEAAIVDQENARAEAEAAPFLDANRVAETATAEETAAAAQQFDARAEGERALANLNERFAHATEHVQRLAKSNAEAYRMQMEQSLAEVRASDINPAQLWGNMSGFERGGSMVAAFVTDFLGAKGIKSSAMDIFNQAIERNIAAQTENLRKKERVADGFRALWDMAMREGASEQEAQQIIHAHMLAAAEKQIAARVGQFDSDIARAQGAKQIAALRTDLATRLAAITDKAYARSQERLGLQLDQEYRAQQLAIQKSQAALGWANHNLNKKQWEAQEAERAAARQQVGLPEVKNLVKDPFTGKPVGVALSDEAWKRLQEKAGLAAEYKLKMDKFISKAKEVGAVYDGPIGWAVNGEASRELKAMWEDLSWSYAAALSGKQMTESETERARALHQINTLFRRGDTAGLVTNTAENVMKSWDVSFKQNTNDLRTLGPGVYTAMQNGYYDAPVSAPDAYAEDYGQQSRGQREKTAVDAVLKKLDTPDRREFMGSAELGEDWQAAGLKLAPGSGSIPGTSVRVEPQVPKFAAGLRDLYDLAINTTTTPEDRATALEVLAIRGGTGNTRNSDGSGNQEEAALANYYLQQAASEFQRRDIDAEVPVVAQAE